MNTLHHIVIVGGGAGGLGLATQLGHKLGKRKQAKITLVDAHLTHIWKPLLHEVAAGTLNSFEDELNYFAHSVKHHFDFQLGRMTAINREQKRIMLAPLLDDMGQEVAPARHITYDTLVIAIGSTANDFGTTGARDNCMFLDSRAQADRFQQQFLNMYLQAHALPANTSLPPELNVAIIGAGATGVELAAELHHASHEFARYGLDDIQPQHVKITLIEAADRVLPVLPEAVSAAAESQLKRKGIHVLTRTKVQAIHAHHIECADGTRIPADLKVWSAGIKAPDFLQGIAGLETNRINQLVVTKTLQTTRDSHIFAFGDCASCTLANMERPVPPRAQTAHQQANYLVKALTAHIQGKALPDYQYNDFGSLISLSEGSSVGNLVGNIHVKGRIARLMYVMLYRMHQYALHGLFRTLLLWGKDQLSKNASPTLKLH
ncbi:NADH dehydrogenase [Agitococcus lubricus]|uniref:NADH dehydrogenase n=2 Tax=Agitococcus lubricus TaxID=1077255 RepID=A0A2T5IX43_9GAMM|nr:NADH dehydrogenase [Agitococcus lubricus]